MIRRTQFLAHPGQYTRAIAMFSNALAEMFDDDHPLHVTVEREDQYAKLRSKLAKRAAKKRRPRV